MLMFMLMLMHQISLEDIEQACSREAAIPRGVSPSPVY